MARPSAAYEIWHAGLGRRAERSSPRNRRSRKDSPPLSRRSSRNIRMPRRPGASSLMRLVNRGSEVNRSRMAESIAFSIPPAVWCAAARSMIVRVADVARTPSWVSRSVVLHRRVVCSCTLGSSDLRMRGTTNSMRSSPNPSSPHHRAAVGPNSAALRPSESAAARTLSSHVDGVARCRNTLSAAGSHVPSSIRSHHCCELNPHAVTSSRVTRWCCASARSISRRSCFLTPTQRYTGTVEAEGEPASDVGWPLRDRRGDGQHVTT